MLHATLTAHIQSRSQSRSQSCNHGHSHSHKGTDMDDIQPLTETELADVLELTDITIESED